AGDAEGARGALGRDPDGVADVVAGGGGGLLVDGPLARALRPAAVLEAQTGEPGREDRVAGLGRTVAADDLAVAVEELGRVLDAALGEGDAGDRPDLLDERGGGRPRHRGLPGRDPALSLDHDPRAPLYPHPLMFQHPSHRL